MTKALASAQCGVELKQTSRADADRRDTLLMSQMRSFQELVAVLLEQDVDCIKEKTEKLKKNKAREQTLH